MALHHPRPAHQLTEDPEAGFLPANTSPPAGDGQVNFTIRQKPGLATGTVIRNKARIVFDANDPIDTPEWANTIDDTAPASQVDSIESAACGATDLTLDWSGTDAGAATDATLGKPAPVRLEGVSGRTFGGVDIHRLRLHVENVQDPPVRSNERHRQRDQRVHHPHRLGSGFRKHE